MDVALNSIFLFLFFIFPGIVFRRFYYVGEFSKQFSSSNWVNTFYISLIPGIIIQIISYFVFLNIFFTKPINIDSYFFINSVYDKLKNNSIPKELFNFELLSWILEYILLTIFISFIIAQFCWIIVRKLDLDKKFTPLRFNNYWHYYLSGESLKFKDFRGIILPNQKVLLTEADVLIDLGNEGTKLYKGFLRQHTICKNSGDLKAVYLTDVRRYTNKPKPNDIKEVPGHIMIIPADKILNINLTYITKSTKIINPKIFLAILNLSILLLLMFNPFNVFLRNTTVFGAIIGRFWLFISWLIVAAILEIFVNWKKDESPRVLAGLLFFLASIFIILYFYFYK